jgi:hypothetical protein
VQSGKNLSATASGDSTLSIADTPETLTDAKKQAWKFTQIDQSDTERPDLKAYVITNTDCKVLVAKDGTNVFSDESVEDAKSDPAARWIFNTSDGATSCSTHPRSRTSTSTRSTRRPVRPLPMRRTAI